MGMTGVPCFEGGQPLLVGRVSAASTGVAFGRPC